MKNVKCNVKQCIIVLILGVLLFLMCCFFAFCNFRNFLDISIFNSNAVYYVFKIFMLFSAVFFGFGLFLLVRAATFYKDKMLEFSDTYLVDNSSFVCGGKIDYSEIESVYIQGLFLCIKFRNEEQFLSRQVFLKRVFMRLNKKMGYDYVTISNNFLDVGLVELESLIKEKISQQN